MLPLFTLQLYTRESTMVEWKLFQASLIFYDILQSRIKMHQDKTFNLKQPFIKHHSIYQSKLWVIFLDSLLCGKKCRKLRTLPSNKISLKQKSDEFCVTWGEGDWSTTMTPSCRRPVFCMGERNINHKYPGAKIKLFLHQLKSHVNNNGWVYHNNILFPVVQGKSFNFCLQLSYFLAFLLETSLLQQCQLCLD